VGVACVVAIAGGAGTAWAFTTQVAYGKPGKVQLVKTEGEYKAPANPKLTFPKHIIRRSPMAKRERQKICSSLQIWTQAEAAPHTWGLKVTNGTKCAWIAPGDAAVVAAWTWEGETFTPYHTKFVVTWATKKRKLAKATYDFNKTTDYKCTTDACLVSTDMNKQVAFIIFTRTAPAP
jgi:hypothetical protein